MSRRLILERAAVGTLMVSFVALLLHDLRLQSDLKTIIRVRSRANSQPPEPFVPGDSIGRLQLLSETGGRVVVQELVGSGVKVVYFHRFDCKACQAQYSDWTDHVSLYGPEGLLFVATEGRPTPNFIELRRGTGVQSYVLAPDSPLRSKVSHVPMILSVDECGLIVARHDSVAGAEEYSRRPQAGSKMLAEPLHVVKEVGLRRRPS